MLQDFGLLDHESALTNVCLPQIIGHRYDKKTAEKATEVLASMGLADVVGKPVYQMSGGQRQRVAIARSITMGAKLLLADEPTGSLDTENTINLMNLFRKINSTGLTIIIATHNHYVTRQCSISYTITDGVLTFDK